MAKRTPPYSIQALLRFDKYVTDEICRFADRFAAVRSFKRQCKTLEYSCHGILWLCAWMIFIWFAWTPSLFQMQVNFLIALILDIIYVGILKAIFRRRRPAGNKPDALEISVDKFSFPSGHVSRAVFILYFFLYLYPINLIFIPPLLAWCVSVSVSRILLRRHHLLDVLGGVVLGLFEGFVMNYLWLSAGSAFYIIEWITDEKFDGGEYHV
ncbi:polyisoprenoid diphosphate/phosphate phosphohydrolase PLPP6 [Planococcus citri]|uniref:polyisoprenoid diphosphate/phosphate phosphohydrolase PLPP6 n=1 Tax=Planococcus citri TaxID=170843 RepID=UPI0031F7DA24